MTAYLFIYFKVSLLGLAVLFCFRRAPARWRFYLCMFCLVAGLIPWTQLPSIETASLAIPWVNDVHTAISLPLAVETTVHRRTMIAPDFIKISSAIGLLAFLLINWRQRAAVRRWSLNAWEHPRLSGLVEGRAQAKVIPDADVAAITGFWTAAIWVGERLMNHPKSTVAIEHELAHLKFNDHRWACVITLIRSILWWNPMIWLWAWLARFEMECACDEYCASQDRSSYQRSLGELILYRHQNRFTQIPGLISSGRSNIFRLKRLEKEPMKKPLHVVALFIAALALPAVSLSLSPAANAGSYGTDMTRWGNWNPLEYSYRVELNAGGNQIATLRYLGTEDGEETYGTPGISLDAKRFKGKNLEFTALIRSEDATSASIWLRVDDANGRTVFLDNGMNRALSGTRDWQEFSVVLPVPDNADKIVAGLLLSNAGSMQITAPEFRETDKVSTAIYSRR